MTTESTATPAQQIAAGYAVEGAALELGTRRRRRDRRSDRAGAHPAGHRQPARPGRRRDRHRQDEVAAGDRRAAVRRRRARDDGRRQGRPVRACRARARPTTRPRSAPPTPATTGRRRRSRSSSCRWAPPASACRCAPPSPASGRSCCRRCWGSTPLRSRRSGLIFHWADQKGLPLLDLKDLRAVIQYLTSDEGKPELKALGAVSSTTAGVILRALVNLEAEGADTFFGEPELEPKDLMRVDAQGRGVITLLELGDQAARPVMFSTFLMWVLADLFTTLPEVGDVDKPKLVFFFDEAHLLFTDASKAFLEQVEQTVKLIRSKGVGVFFCTQLPTDVPNNVLSQLGARIQHALRAFTPDDQKALSKTVRTYPKTDCLRPGVGADVAGHRRGDRHGAVREGRADAGGVDPDAGAALADGHHRSRRDQGRRAGQPAAGRVRPDRRPRVGLRAAQRAKLAPPEHAPVGATTRRCRRRYTCRLPLRGPGHGAPPEVREPGMFDKMMEQPGVQERDALGGHRHRPRDHPQHLRHRPPPLVAASAETDIPARESRDVECRSQAGGALSFASEVLVAAEFLVDRADDRRDDRRAARSRWPPTSPWTSPRARRASCCAPSASSDTFAVYSVEIHRKSGISFSTSDCSCSIGQGLAHRAGRQHRHVHAGALELAAQRLAERVDERLGRRVGGVVRNRRIARRRTGNQDAARAALDHSRQHGERQGRARQGHSAAPAPSRRPDPAWRPDRRSRCPRWRTGSRCCGRPARRQSLPRSAGIGEVDGAHLDGHAVLLR